MKINRRNFFAGLTAGLASLSSGKKLSGSSSHGLQMPPVSTSPSEPKIVKYKPLGNTGLKVSDVIGGTTAIFSANVIRYAYDLGVTTFDTAETYMNGLAEQYIGEALAGKRDKTVIITKFPFRRPDEINKEKILKRVEESLKRLKTDYVDGAFLHGISSTNKDLLKNEILYETFNELKKAGKIRFRGFSCHSNMDEVLKAALDSEFTEAAIFAYNHIDGPAIEPLIQKARARGIGTIAMKVFAGGMQGNLKRMVTENTTYAQAAIAWILSNKDMDCAALSMRSYSHVEEYVGASGKELNRADIALLKEYRKQVDREYCRIGCTQCEKSCPKGVAISDIMRYSMYYDHYGFEKMAIEHYAGLEKTRNSASCQSCTGRCNSACPYRLDVRGKLIRSHNVLSA